MVQQLVLKDCILQRKISILYLLYPGLLLLINFKNESLITICCLTIPLVGTMFSSSQEEKNNSEKVLNSLPFKRKEIVMAKYIFSSLLILIGIILGSMIGSIQLRYGISHMDVFIVWCTVLGGITGAVVYVSLALPLVFSIGHSKAKNIAPFIGGFLAFLSGSIVKNLWTNQANEWAFNFTVNIIFVAVLVLFYIVSMWLSISLYKERDL
ncbi:ABC transporter permease [Bacillus pseudomycoides]|uniref:ABC transporter permease n=1 Tax=Bacillus pseudomycoides TaxID=64104 RepID=A0AA91VEQ1_9BACI|nr:MULTISPECIES: ABC-2 transporter permease [Bacillus]PEB53311.1 ABC transporter permease [Bacillus sp. AFS098217]PED83820.1 ABC transporter permease [Bacillus pseudomycoides]PEU14710.1 ABC transporter permease [Bacillus sp. AFS019443]PEU19537.1 ABC transporter permease [Bacillus sp. AFS014408]PFW64381.1 ABC transporter permease [Bacillus sp. AFS075034]